MYHLFFLSRSTTVFYISFVLFLSLPLSLFLCFFLSPSHSLTVVILPSSLNVFPSLSNLLAKCFVTTSMTRRAIAIVRAIHDTT